MPWAKFDGRFASNPKVQGLSPGAFRMYVNSIVWCAEHLTDGRFRVRDRVRFSHTSRSGTVARLSRELYETGLWERRKGMIEIHDFLEYNPSKEQVEQRREQNREAQAKYRNKQSQQSLTKSDDVSRVPSRPVRDLLSLLSPDGEGGGPDEPPPPEATTPNTDPMLASMTTELTRRGVHVEHRVLDAAYRRYRTARDQGTEIRNARAYIESIYSKLLTETADERRTADRQTALADAINNCGLCDERGIIIHDDADGLWTERCDHRRPT